MPRIPSLHSHAFAFTRPAFANAPAFSQAQCLSSGHKVILKVYSLNRVADNAVHTLVREIRIHSDLSHSNVLMMYGVFEVRGVGGGVGAGGWKGAGAGGREGGWLAGGWEKGGREGQAPLAVS